MQDEEITVRIREKVNELNQLIREAESCGLVIGIEINRGGASPNDGRLWLMHISRDFLRRDEKID